jgi:hypothetical protein
MGRHVMPGRAVALAVTTSLLMLLMATLPGLAVADTDPVPTPTIEHVPDDVGLHGHPLWDPWFDPAEFGYESHEYFISGTARATGSDDTADYTTRIVVNRPADPAAFAGTVLLDWVNVTAQFENAVNTLTSIEFLLREGWAFIHVSAQAAGICCTPGLTPQTWDPVRYAALSHPGDQYANDIFSQVAVAIRGLADVDPMDGLDVEVVIAAGQSQGGSRLSNYIATTAADHGVIDAVLAQAGGSKQYEQAPSLPVIHLLGEREGTPSDPTPWPTYRLWEVAGSAHQDSWVGRQQTEGTSVRLGSGQQSRSQAESLWASAGNYGEQVDPRSGICVINGALFPTRYASNAALAALDRWVREGTPAPEPPRYHFDGDALDRDAFQIAGGGLRLPPADLPVARYLSDTCNLGGKTVPLTEVELIAEYGDHDSYFAAMVEATEASVLSGYLLVDDALDLLERACNARLRFLDTSTEACGPAPSFSDEFSPAPDPGDDPPASDTDEPANAEQGALPSTGGGQALLALAFVGLAAIGLALLRRR